MRYEFILKIDTSALNVMIVNKKLLVSLGNNELRRIFFSRERIYCRAEVQRPFYYLLTEVSNECEVICWNLRGKASPNLN